MPVRFLLAGVIAIAALAIPVPTASAAVGNAPNNGHVRQPLPSPQGMFFVLERMSGLWSTPRCVGDGRSGPRIGVIYASPEGTPSRFAQLRPWIQVALAAATGVVEHSSQGRRTIRWVHGPDCEPLVIEITAPAARLATWDGVLDALDDEPGIRGRNRVWLVYADAAPAEPQYAGKGGYGYAVVWPSGWGAAEAHELIHAIGGVSDQAPHATGAGHCNDGRDVMCYDDGGPAGQQIVRCDGELDPWLMDCGGDDYFNLAPEPGSWLARHPRANIAWSRYLQRTAALDLPRRPEPPTGLVASRSAEGLLSVSWTNPLDLPVEVRGWSADGRLLRLSSGTTGGHFEQQDPDGIYWVVIRALGTAGYSTTVEMQVSGA